MAAANRALAALCSADGPMTVTALMDAIGQGRHASSRARRKPLLAHLGRLMRRKLVKQTRPRQKETTERPPEALYAVTAEGRRFAASGKRIAGAIAQRRYSCAYKADAFYQRLWKALRMVPGRRASAPDLVELVRRDGDPSPEKMMVNARAYLRKLARAGIVVRMAVRAKGDAPTSNGFVRFALPRDLGPLAPVTRKGFVFDPNSKSKIEYRKEAA